MRIWVRPAVPRAGGVARGVTCGERVDGCEAARFQADCLIPASSGRVGQGAPASSPCGQCPPSMSWAWCVYSLRRRVVLIGWAVVLSVAREHPRQTYLAQVSPENCRWWKGGWLVLPGEEQQQQQQFVVTGPSQPWLSGPKTAGPQPSEWPPSFLLAFPLR